VENCTFTRNLAGETGAALFNDGTGDGKAALSANNCTFSVNSVTFGANAGGGTVGGSSSAGPARERS